MASDREPITYTFRYFETGVIVSTANHVFQDDQHAIRLASGATFGFDLEVWDDGRFVVRVSDTGSSGLPPDR